MLSQLAQLSFLADGRYATAEELQFLKDYFSTFKLRLRAYEKLKKAENSILKKTYQQIYAVDANLFQIGTTDFSAKWRTDTIRVLRYSCTALLINDPDYLRDRLLLWFSTVLQAFQAQEIAQATYQVLQIVVQDYLTPEEFHLFLPILETNISHLSKVRD